MTPAKGLRRIDHWVPLIGTLRTYRREWWSGDLVAGLSVAAVALPIGIAYAQLAGFPPAVGIYSAILPAVAYALCGSSRQLVVNPDAAVCAMLAATVAPLAAGNPSTYADLSILLTLMTGLLCILGGLAGFGVIANFLSRPILTGYLNGIALSIIAGQIGTLLGFRIEPAGFFRTVAAAAARLDETHMATLAVGAGLFAIVLMLKKVAPRIPAPLVAAIIGIAAVYALELQARGVTVVGPVPAGLPTPRIPVVSPAALPDLLFGACGIVLVSFCSMMTTARGFAAKNGYSIDVNRDMVALGVADLASGLSRGFAISGADSRTAVADASGGKTQVATVVAAAAMALVLIFLTAPLAYVPTAALAAILISSALGLFDFASLRRYYRLSPAEFRQSIAAMLGVMTVGVLPGVLIAIGMAILRLLVLASRPHDAVIVPADGKEGAAGVVVYRFDSSLLFFNAERFLDRVRQVIADASTPTQTFIFDAEAVPLLDITGADALDRLHDELAERGIAFAIARPKGMFRIMLERSGAGGRIGPDRLFPTIHEAVEGVDIPRVERGAT